MILNITGYFAPGESQGVDPFALQKRQGLETGFDAVTTVCHQVNSWLDNPESEEALFGLLYFIS